MCKDVFRYGNVLMLNASLRGVSSMNRKKDEKAISVINKIANYSQKIKPILPLVFVLAGLGFIAVALKTLFSDDNPSSPAAWISAAAGVYSIIRGFSNGNQNTKKTGKEDNFEVYPKLPYIEQKNIIKVDEQDSSLSMKSGVSYKNNHIMELRGFASDESTINEHILSAKEIVMCFLSGRSVIGDHIKQIRDTLQNGHKVWIIFFDPVVAERIDRDILLGLCPMWDLINKTLGSISDIKKQIIDEIGWDANLRIGLSQSIPTSHFIVYIHDDDSAYLEYSPYLQNTDIVNSLTYCIDIDKFDTKMEYKLVNNTGDTKGKSDKPPVIKRVESDNFYNELFFLTWEDCHEILSFNPLDIKMSVTTEKATEEEAGSVEKRQKATDAEKKNMDKVAKEIMMIKTIEYKKNLTETLNGKI